MFRGARLGGFLIMEQLHSSVVIAKDTSSVTMFDSILPGALESASAGKPPAPAHRRGPEEDGCGGQVVQEVVEQHPQISLSVVTFLRAGNRKQ